MYQPYSYADSYQQLMERHHKKIQQLEKEIDELKKIVTELRSQPPLKIDRIEYKFDQLKIETLEGTLNVGISPQDLQNIGDLSTGQHPVPSPVYDPKNVVIHDLIEEKMNQYLDESVPQIISDTKDQLGIQPNESYLELISQDIKNQLKTRIRYHIGQLPPQVIQQESAEQVAEMVSARIRGEIQQGIYSFLTRFQSDPKGENPHNGV
ncbi:spore germination protein PC [Bacillus oleivorans]|uniref:Spore germination protein PC n=1 Tax=Bacillus oleivorans TaxID=1448271 RepID=A0A285CSP7_9BACI|nr:spore germination protein GerPC [Bacillus oleivorans]SNX70068.1 spore germination protein PC [Bacillus oleivorans]